MLPQFVYMVDASDIAKWAAAEARCEKLTAELAEVKGKLEEREGMQICEPSDEWQWPEFIKPGWWLAMDCDCRWFAYECEPYISGQSWNSNGFATMITADLINWTPPPCADWKTSKRQKPLTTTKTIEPRIVSVEIGFLSINARAEWKRPALGCEADIRIDGKSCENISELVLTLRPMERIKAQVTFTSEEKP